MPQDAGFEYVEENSGPYTLGIMVKNGKVNTNVDVKMPPTKKKPMVNTLQPTPTPIMMKRICRLP
jgi:hypothetical protein